MGAILKRKTSFRRFLIKFFLLLPLFCAQFTLFAADLYQTQYSLGDTTDKINFRDLIISGDLNKKNLFWPYLNQSANKHSFDFTYHHRYQKGPSFKFKYNEVKFAYAQTFKDKYRLSLTTGLYHFDERKPGKSSANIRLEGQLEALLPYNITGVFKLGRGPAINEIFLTGVGFQNIESTKAAAVLTKQLFKEKVALRVDVRRHHLREGVEQTFFDGEIMAALMKYPHWIRIGFGYHTLDYNKNSNSYWSPLDFYSFGPRIDLSFLFREVVQLYFGGNYSWFEENETFSGDGYYMRTGIKYGIREDFMVDLAYERNESIQNNNSWIGKSVILAGNYFF